MTDNIKFTELQDWVLANLDSRNHLVSYLQTSISEVVDEIWAGEYKDSHPDLDRFMDDPNDTTDIDVYCALCYATLLMKRVDMKKVGYHKQIQR